MENIKILFNEFFLNLISNEWAWDLVALNSLIVTALLFIVKFKISALTGVSFKEELSEKDNPAFGLVIGVTFLSFFLIMSGAASGESALSYLNESILLSSYGLIGIVMLLLSRIFFDKVSMNAFCISEQLRKRNMAAATIDAGNMLATSLIIYAYMGWVKGTDLNTILVVCYGWVISQVLLSLISLTRHKMYKSINDHTLAEAIKSGNLAVAIRYTGYKLAIAFTPLIAAKHYDFSTTIAYWQATEIFLASILLSVVLLIVTKLIKISLLRGIDFKDEINEQQNTGAAFVEASIVFGLALFLNQLL